MTPERSHPSAEPERLRIVLADDHAVVRAGIRRRTTSSSTPSGGPAAAALSGGVLPAGAAQKRATWRAALEHGQHP